MTISSFNQTCLLRFGQQPDSQRFNDDFYNALNDAQKDIANRRPWGFLRTTSNLTTTVNVRTIALPSNFGRPYNFRGAIRITSPSGSLGDTIQLMSMDDWYNNEYEDGSSTGEPTYAYIMGDSLYLSPIPDTSTYVIAMMYFKRPSDIVDSNDEITIPAAYDELLKKMVYRRLQDSGYSSVQELTISDNDIDQLMNAAARDDIAKYGSLSFNLAPREFKLRTV